MRIFKEYKIIIDFFMKEQGKNLKEAVQMAQVPPNLTDQIMDYFNPEQVTIKDISTILEHEKNVKLCEPHSKDEIYFRDFIDFIEHVRKWPRAVTENLSRTSNKLLEYLPDPQDNESFQYKGLVVGNIQSGKTANMSALIARAADHGYRFFIILAGRYKDLRLQTQNRMDQDITGESEIEFFQCVQHEEGTLKWNRMTKAEMKGDFQRGTATFDPNPDTPKLAVIKKNTKVMANLIQYLQHPTVPLKDVPALIIDDECDDASIDTNYAEEDDEPSKTNARIRELLQVFPKYVYIGFTATPFANVLIDAEVPEDLYPKNFISVLKEPKDYLGPRQLFGLGMIPSELSDEEGPAEMDIIRFISPEEDKVVEQSGLSDEPPSIIEQAILTYILSCCARMARGQAEDHFSMLVHPSHRKNIHGKYKKWIEDNIDFLKQVVRHPSKAKEYIKEAKTIWETDFIETSKKLDIDKGQLFSFEQIWKFAKEIVDSFEIKVLNSDFQDNLEYHRDKRRYIVVGGNKLSRGLTLEGLSVSLYLRPEPSGGHKYDTLLQMGRWFGYRKGYHDLTRIFVNPETADDFSDLARVELELRADLQKYSKSPDPPTPLGIKPLIRAHDTMSVTSTLKFGSGKRINRSLQGGIRQTIAFPLNNISILKQNQQIVKAWLKALGKPVGDEISQGSWTWKNVQPDRIIKLIQSYSFSQEAIRVNKDILKNYVEKQNEKKELTDWTVILPSGSRKGEPYPWMSGVSTGKITRRLNKRKTGKRTAIKVLTESKDIKSVWEIYKISPSPEYQSDPKKGALLFYIVDKYSGAGTDKALFPNSEREDIVGLAFIFPHSRSQATVEWVTQGRGLF